MKSIPCLMCLFVFLLCSKMAFSISRTVDNQGSGQFATIDAAVQASSPGDTVYIMGSPSYYYTSNPVWKDSLTFIGPGFNPDKQNPVSAIVASSWRVGIHTTFMGMQMVGVGQPSGNVADMRFVRCYLSGFPQLWEYASYSNLVFEGCIFSNLTLFRRDPNAQLAPPDYLNNTVIRNCLFYNSAVTGGGLTAISNVLIENCTFFSTNAITIFNGIPANSTISLSNSIFYNCNALFTGASFHHNFSNLENLNVNGGTNNLQGTSPGFVNAPGGTFSFSHDYHLATGSPCIGTGTSGTDMGIFGGANPLHWDGASVLPQIRYFNVLGSQINQGGNLKVTFQSLIKD